MIYDDTGLDLMISIKHKECREIVNGLYKIIMTEIAEKKKRLEAKRLLRHLCTDKYDD